MNWKNLGVRTVETIVPIMVGVIVTYAMEMALVSTLDKLQQKVDAKKAEEQKELETETK